jgi:glycosyltransferase involved in cell wall biosynthesis
LKILHLIRSVDPEGGGPIEYARVMAQAHSGDGHESVFVTLDEPGQPFLSEFPFQVEATGPVRGLLRQAPAFGPRVAELMEGADAAVIHGLWTYATVGAYGEMKRAGFPWLVFTHGMLDPYFRKANPLKHGLKQIYWSLRLGRVLTEAHAVLFSCEEEQRLAKGAFVGHQDYHSKVLAFCASDQTLPQAQLVSGRAEFRALVPKLGDRPYLLFLSRIHPKKACDNLIDAFAAVADRHPDLDLVIAGPDQIGWTTELKAQAVRHGIAERIHWPGMVKGAAKSAAFADARAFVLPSHQENFGLVVAEALSVGTPVLISDKVNIWREVVTDKVGLAVRDTTAETTAMIDEFLSMPTNEVTVMRAACRLSYKKRFSVESAASELAAAVAEAARTKRRAVNRAGIAGDL